MKNMLFISSQNIILAGTLWTNISITYLQEDLILETLKSESPTIQ